MFKDLNIQNSDFCKECKSMGICPLLEAKQQDDEEMISLIKLANEKIEELETQSLKDVESLEVVQNLLDNLNNIRAKFVKELQNMGKGRKCTYIDELGYPIENLDL
jgi:hypothetical protein